jgi:hypothetical protein
MAINIILNHINESVEIGDVVYYVNVGSASVYGVSDAFLTGDMNNIKELGPITHFISGAYGTGITVDNSQNNTPDPPNGAFLMFSKNKVANTSGLLGYYIDIDFKNDSTDKVELFQIGLNTEMSSK